MSEQSNTAGADERSTPAQTRAPETTPAPAPAPVIDAEAIRAEERARAVGERVDR